MPELEDKLIRIVELRGSGLEDEAIAVELGTDVESVQMHDRLVREGIQGAMRIGKQDLQEIASYLGFSSENLERIAAGYDIEINPHNSGKYLAKISKVLESGLKTRREIAKETDIVYSQVCRIVREHGIDVKSPVTSELLVHMSELRRRNVERVKQAHGDGIKTRRGIVEVSGLSYGTVANIAKSEGLEVESERSGGRKKNVNKRRQR